MKTPAPAPAPTSPPEATTAAKETERVRDLQEQVRQLQQSLALADAEAETLRRQWQDLRLRNQALGVDAITADQKKLEDRVVEAVKELYQAEQERRSAVNRLQQLMDAGQELLRGAEKLDPKLRADYEVAVRAAREFLADREKPDVAPSGDLSGAQIVHVNGTLDAVVLNVGGDLGVKPGMPFLVFRPDGPGGKVRLVARLKAFEVRQAVCAALVDSVEKGVELKVGDRAAVAAEK